MTRFVSPNLADLPPPDIIETIDFESIVSARISDLTGRLNDVGQVDAAAVLQLETEPLTIAQETDGYAELLLRQRVNDAVRAVLMASATGGDLDQLAATFYGATRLTITPENDATSPPTPAVMEDDDTFRARALLSMEAYSCAGPEGGYIYFAVSVSGVLDAVCYGEEDGALYADSTPVIAPEVLVVVLSQTGDGTPSDDLISAVGAALSPKDIRPIGDKVTVEPATITTYSITGVLKYADGSDPAPLITTATTQVQAYVNARQRIGRVHQVLGIGAAMKVTNVEEIAISSPPADIDPGSKGAAYCTEITITAEVAEDDWR